MTVAAPGWSKAITTEEAQRWERAVPGFVIPAAWTEGEARERGVVVSDAEAREALDERPHDGLTRSDLLYQARITLLTARIDEHITQPAALSVTPEQVEAYVHAHPRTDPETRAVRLVRAASRADAKRALAALARGLTWASAIRRYSDGGSGRRTIEPGALEERVERAVFRAPRNALTRYGTDVFKVIAINPPRPAPLDQQRASAWEILASDAQQQALEAFRRDLRAKWRPRTTCAAGYASSPDCGNPPTGE